MVISVYAQSKDIREKFAARIAEADPSDPLTDDPIWNPKHKLHKSVNRLIERGVSAVDAERRVRSGEKVPTFAPTEYQIDILEGLHSPRMVIAYEGEQRVVYLDHKRVGSVTKAMELIDEISRNKLPTIENVW